MIKRIFLVEEIEAILLQFDKSFPRALSIRVDSLLEYARKLAKHAVVKAFYIDSQIIGFCAYYCNNKGSKTAFLTQLAVLERNKDSGIGSALLNDCILDCKNNQMINIECEVDYSNIVAINFYKKNGFKFSRDVERESCLLIKYI